MIMLLILVDSCREQHSRSLSITGGPAPVRGLGSGIFYHTSPIGEKWTPTLACTKVGEPAEMRWILRWLKPAAKPRVVNNI